jgi:hypothetical protein
MARLRRSGMPRSARFPIEHFDHQVTDLVDHHRRTQASRWPIANGDRRELANRR